jgi:hypothetical protein
MKIELKVKLISLGLEAQAIRRIERKLKSKPGFRIEGSNTRKAFKSIQDHRRQDIRSEARHSHLAYGFLRGRAYAEIERSTYTNPDWGRVLRIARRFSDEDQRIVDQRFAEWKAQAGEEGRFLFGVAKKVRVRPVRQEA